ncbi:MAG: tripartite tricarboxylate transporter permease [Planktomarina sp.]
MEFLWYFGQVFEPANFGLLLIGTIGGLILGATPGLSPTMAVALAIPFTFRMEPVQGLILLGALYTSTVAGGAVSAILLKIPGAPANIATTLDGHTMALNGEGKRALRLSFIASLFGGAFGIMLLIFLTPILAQWALEFQPAQLFWLAIVGVTIIATLDSNSVVKGLLAGCIGMWLGTIGFDDILGAQRFIFHPSLSGGIHIIPALIGLFAIPQVISMFAKGRVKSEFDDPDAQKLTIKQHIDAVVAWVREFKLMKALTDWFIGVGLSVGDVFKYGRSLTIGGIVGAVVGLIPGVGGQIAGLVAYDQSRNFSKEREKFGTGHPEGIISAESANNAMVGPSLVPLLTLSIPGSPTAAVLLGGLIIHGIFPGPDIFTSYPEVIWPFINSMLLGQVMMCLFGILIAGMIASIVKVHHSTMAAAVLALALFGSYSVQLSMGDVYIMLCLGTGMYFLERWGFSAAPLVLGLILGPIAEGEFVTGAAMAAAQDGIFDFFTRGVMNKVLIFLVFASIAYAVWIKQRTAKGSAA